MTISGTPMLSYAQNAEDVVLWRAFRDLPGPGRFIDVGAAHPVIDSVTKHFSTVGWHGIHVEPMGREADLLRRDRPGDVVLQIALGREAGQATLYEAPLDNRGASSLRSDIAEEQSTEASSFVPVTVEVRTLASVCEEFVTGEIEFLKIDVEGLEADVIAGGDWDRFRPQVVVVEATHPQTSRQVHDEWEPALVAVGYEFTLFDGLNRFYVAHERRELAERLSAPANPIDNWLPYRWVHQVETLTEYTASLLAEVERLRPIEESARRDARRLHDLEVSVAGAQATINDLRQANAVLTTERRRAGC